MLEKRNFEEKKPNNQNKNSAEFDFHQERFRREAEKQQNTIASKFFGKKEVTDEDVEKVIRAEAERDNADFERRKSEEYEKWKVNLQKVVDNIKEKRDSPENAREIRPLLLILGGGMKGAYAAGQSIGLHEIGLGEAFETVVGISAGSGTASYFVAGPEQALINASMYSEECMSKDFLDLLRFRQILDATVIAKATRTGDKALDEDVIRRSPTELYAGATDSETGALELINIKTAGPDMTAALEASAAIPFFRDPVEVNGNTYIDGAFNQVPLEEIIKKFKPTDVLVLPNMSFDYMNTFSYSDREKLMMWGAARMGSLGSIGSLGSVGTVEEFFKIKEHIRNFLENIQREQQVNIGVMWPPDEGMGNLTQNADTVKAAILGAARATIKEFGEEQPDEIKSFQRKNPPALDAA